MPERDGALSDFLQLVTLTHVRRWHAYHGTTGTGHLYQGRFKSFLVQDDAHFLTVCRYVEANALRAGLAERAEGWSWEAYGGCIAPGPRRLTSLPGRWRGRRIGRQSLTKQ